MNNITYSKIKESRSTTDQERMDWIQAISGQLLEECKKYSIFENWDKIGQLERLKARAMDETHCRIEILPSVDDWKECLEDGLFYYHVANEKSCCSREVYNELQSSI